MKRNFIGSGFLGLVLLVGYSAGQSAPIGLAQQLMRDDSMVQDIASSDSLTAAKVARRLITKRIDLNGDGAQEYIVHGIGCGSANCQHWVYQKHGSTYVLVPGTLEGIFVRALTKRSNGWRDLEFAWHSSSSKEPKAVYKFNGRRYETK